MDIKLPLCYFNLVNVLLFSLLHLKFSIDCFIFLLHFKLQYLHPPIVLKFLKLEKNRLTLG